MLLLTLAIHWLHVLGGIVWFGSQIFLAAILWPALLRRPPAEARAVYSALGAPASRVMAPAGMFVLVFGIISGTWLGPIRSWPSLVGTAYGVTFLAALVLTVALMVYGGVTRGQLPARVWDGDVYARGAAAWLRRTGAVTLTGLGAVLACMVAMRFGK